MTFYDFLIMADQPADPKVNVVTQLDDNWEKFDDRITTLQLATSVDDIPVGMRETGMLIAGRLAGVDSLFRYTGAAWARCTDYTKFWSAWTNVGLDLGLTHYPTAPLRWRNNSVLRMVELSGGFLSNIALPGTYTSIVNPVAGSGIPNSLRPVGASDGRAFGIVAAFPQVDANPASQYSTGSVLVKGAGPDSECDLQAKWAGQNTPPPAPPAGEGRGFFFDRVRWFY